MDGTPKRTAFVEGEDSHCTELTTPEYRSSQSKHLSCANQLESFTLDIFAQFQLGLVLHPLLILASLQICRYRRLSCLPVPLGFVLPHCLSVYPFVFFFALLLATSVPLHSFPGFNSLFVLA